jgi:hypothetical protein
MSRYGDIVIRSAVPTDTTPLPAVDYAAVSQPAPVALPIAPRQPTDSLPRADVVVMTWTEAEWTALDHVFLRSAKPSSSTVSWQTGVSMPETPRRGRRHPTGYGAIFNWFVIRAKVGLPPQYFSSSRTLIWRIPRALLGWCSW